MTQLRSGDCGQRPIRLLIEPNEDRIGSAEAKNSRVDGVHVLGTGSVGGVKDDLLGGELGVSLEGGQVDGELVGGELWARCQRRV